MLKNYLLILLWISCIFLSISSDASKLQPIPVSDDNKAKFVGTSLQYFPDPTMQLGILDILESSSQIKDSDWLQGKQEVLSFGYQNSAYWFKGKIANTDNYALQGLIEVGNPLLDEIEYYFVIDGEIEFYYLTGDQYPITQRFFHHRNFIFPFELVALQEGEFYIRVLSTSSLQVPIKVGSRFQFFRTDNTEIGGKAFYYGVMLVMLLFNLFLFLSLREKVYLYYIFFVFGFVTQQASLQGFASSVLWPENPSIQDFTVIFFMPFTILFACLFARKFLKLEETAPWFNRLFTFYIYSSCLVMLLVFWLDFGVSSMTTAIFAVLVSFSCLLVGPIVWYRGYKFARFYSIAWLFVALGSALLALNKLGFVPRNLLTENGLLFGSAFEAILLSFALADRMNLEREERTKAQNKALMEAKIREEAEHELVRYAMHHPATGMPNRVFLETWFKQRTDNYNSTHPFALLLLHPTRFEEINHTLGHKLADQLLRLVALRLNEVAASRHGLVALEADGDKHFVCIVEGVYLAFFVDLEVQDNPTYALKHLLHALDKPIEFQDLIIDVGATGAWAKYPDHAQDSANLVRSALIGIDVGGTRNRTITEYSDGINPYSERRLTLVGELRHALADDGLEVYFQPQLSVRDDKVVGLEALLRWHHEMYGFIAPDEFIPIAEQSGIITILTEWVMDKAIQKIELLNQNGFEVSVSVNISTVNLRDVDFAKKVNALLHKYNVNANQLVIEVTETAMMEEPELALEILQEINGLGVKVSIDDFGTGHSSLSYIKRLPVKEIKIDRAFVMEMDNSEDDSIIVSTTINMCHSLGLEVVAEGVETIAIAEQLKMMGCDFIQGYGLSRPITFDELLAWLKENPKFYSKV